MPEYKTKVAQLYVYSIFDPVFKINFYLNWCEDRERLQRLLNRNTEDDVAAICKNTAGILQLLLMNASMQLLHFFDINLSSFQEILIMKKTMKKICAIGIHG
jgi:hypothetical protein